MVFKIEYFNHVMDKFEFESGRTLENVNVEYWFDGTPVYDDDGNIINAILYCPNLKQGYSIFAEYHGDIYDEFKDDYFFIMITSIGTPDSCCPSSTGLKYDFPHFTIKDIVNFKRQFLVEKFNIKKLKGIIGEVAGGFEVYTWASEYPDEMEFIINFNTTFKTYGYRYIFLNVLDAIVDSCDDFYEDGYSVNISKIMVAITKLIFAGYYPKNVLEEMSNDEIDVLMADYVDTGLFMDIHDFKSRNDGFLEYDVSDKLDNIKADALIMSSSENLFFNNEKDILPLKEIIKDSKIVMFDNENSQEDYLNMSSEIITFLKQFI